MKPAGTQKWIDDGYIDTSKPIPLIEAELRFANGYIAEQPMFCQNVALTQQILGIGGWMFSGFQSRYMLGADKEYKGLGFTCVESKEDWGEAVSKAPIGLDGLFEAFSPPYYSNMGEAVEAFNDMKWSNWEEKFMPYKDPTGVLKDTPRPSKKEIEIVKDICTYLYETYGRFPAFSDAMDVIDRLIIANVINNDYEFGFRFGEAVGLPLLTEDKYSGYLDGTVPIPTPEWEIENIRVLANNKNTNSYSCAAELYYEWDDKIVKNLSLVKYISYNVDETTDGNIYISNFRGF